MFYYFKLKKINRNQVRDAMTTNRVIEESYLFFFFGDWHIVIIILIVDVLSIFMKHHIAHLFE